MVTREQIAEEIERLSDENLEAVYKMIKTLEVNGRQAELSETVMSGLRKISISASPDFSTKANLYDLKDEDAS